MADRHYSLTLRSISAIVLAFFIWTVGGLFEVAYAVKNDDHLRDATTGRNSSMRSARSSAAKKNSASGRPEGEFEQTLDEMRVTLSDDKTDVIYKKNKLKEKKSKIESLNVDIKKQFDATEKKLKDAGLPQEILRRHYDFVKKYDDNLKELKTDLDNLDKAKNESDARNEIETTRAFLEKVKPPKKLSHLDPNKLPHRAAEPVWIEPRTTPEQFQEEHQYAPGLINKKKAALLASNGSLEGTMSKESVARQTTSEAMHVAMTNPPTNDDLVENGIEIVFTAAIRAKAAELENNPVRIYNWVRNNIEYVPTHGSIQGADYCLQTKRCNDIDTASLLIALLRVSGIHAQYVYGTIELPIEKVMNWVGGFKDPFAMLSMIAAGGIPVTGITESGKIAKVQKEHVWVQAFIDYIPSRGARHKEGNGDTWVSLDPSFKQYTYTTSNIESAVAYDSQSLLDQVESTSAINLTAGYVTNLNSVTIQRNFHDYLDQVQNYIFQSFPSGSPENIIAEKKIVEQHFPYLLGTLPYKKIVTGAKYSVLPDSLRRKMLFNLTVNGIDYEMPVVKSLPELAGSKITLSYTPATSSDQAVINSYLPKPHSDGSPIQPSELPKSLPAYLIHLKPELRINGNMVASGSAIQMGQNETFNIVITCPNMSRQAVTNNVVAGEFNAIGLDISNISAGQIASIKAKLESTKAKLEAEDFSLSNDDLVGDILLSTIVTYFAELDGLDFHSANNIRVISFRLPSAGRSFNALTIDYMWNVPMIASAAGLSMDVGLVSKQLRSADGIRDKEVQFMISSGLTSSTLEHAVPELLFSSPDQPTQGISAVKTLRIANDRGIPIYVINKDNLTGVIPELQLSDEVKNDIRDAVNAGKIVITSNANISLGGWAGCGYIILDTSNGAGAYMLSGGIAGGFVEEWLGVFMLTMRDPASMAMLNFGSGTIGTYCPNCGAAIAAFSAVYQLIDILCNSNSPWSQKGCVIAANVASSLINVGLGYLAGKGLKNGNALGAAGAVLGAFGFDVIFEALKYWKCGPIQYVPGTFCGLAEE